MSRVTLRIFMVAAAVGMGVASSAWLARAAPKEAVASSLGIERSGLFHRLIAVSSSLWCDDRLIFRHEQKFSEAVKRLDARIYCAVGSREVNRSRSMVADLDVFSGQVRGRSYDGPELWAETLDNETHNTVFPRALSNGLRFVFEVR